MKKDDHKTVVCFGEALWDDLPQGKKIGGAPLNVAYHLCKLGIDAMLISRIGEDKDGDDLEKFLRINRMNYSFLQKDPVHPTGKVTVKIPDTPDGEVTYDIVREAAWDYIAYEERFSALIENAGYIVYGSLAARNDVSKHTLLKIINTAGAVKVFDVNLREPFYSEEVIRQLMLQADIVKMNRDELKILSRWFDIRGEEASALKEIRAKFNLDVVIVTRSSEGATLCCEERIIRVKGHPVNVVDTVGSGDAFLAAFLAGLINGGGYAGSLESGNALGAFIAGKEGACTEYTVSEINRLLN